MPTTQTSTAIALDHTHDDLVESFRRVRAGELVVFTCGNEVVAELCAPQPAAAESTPIEIEPPLPASPRRAWTWKPRRAELTRG